MKARQYNSKSILYHYARIRAYVLLGLLLSTLAILGGMVFRNLSHFETVRSYVDYSHRILQVTLDLQGVLSKYLDGNESKLDSDRVRQLSSELDLLAQSNYHARADTPEMLLKAKNMILTIADKQQLPAERESILLNALNLTVVMLDSETEERENQLEEITKIIGNEIGLAGGTLILVIIMIIVFVQSRILAPLQDLRILLLNLAREDFTPIETEYLDPLLLPIFSSYNEMVIHLAELEETKRNYAESLEQEVRSATRAMLEQQASLAQAERLAVVGELAANIAHELRNPLAGIQMCCINIRNETTDPDKKERLDLVVSELKRMSKLLSDLLDKGKHEPVNVTDCNMEKTIRELATLTRYQISREIELIVDVQPGLICRVPECQLRQTLLNLILNASHALGNGKGHIKLTAFRKENMVNLTISDTGPGFSRYILENDIRPFTTGRPGGTGLGLAMVKRFVYDRGGKMFLENVEPHGARITILIPC